ncbi:cation:proton antiporter [Micromonospora endophytica]|uniref:Cation/H(+) antiporter n=1 Tax=Micromonospora endophytica TaxID=515350 RepID=A0A2W2DA71_9ACTN|nr:cation:proton antiporter [Micromonospora endophytica]PZF89493.1 cation/H(+) antiporter [Micromonospora endophytica]RIW43370.1 cation/H(+) antiporter [Micromonospora endophytica]BCJ58793.1 sodium:proton antiporter [Micromonospora endophytica]
MTSHAVGQLLLGLAVIIVLARALGALARKIGQPPVIGEIIAGILIGPSIFGTLVSDRLFPSDVLPALAGLANIGLVLFMFIVGYELDQTLVRGRQRVAVSVSIGSILAPLGLGAVLALWLAGRHDVTDTLPFTLFIGAAMAVTAFPVLARIVADRGLIRTEVGGLALASAAVDDVIAWSLLAVVVAVGTADGGLPWQVLGIIPFLFVMFRWVRPLLRRLAVARERAGRLTPDILAVILAGLLISCYLTEIMGLHAIFGAFVFGAVMPRVGGEALRHEILERLEQVSVLLLLPVFFVVAGLQVDLSTVDGSALLELALILLVAISGKFIGAYAGARLNRVGARQAGALATLMNTRGLTEIVILSVGLQLAIIDQQIFSMMVVMALVTTIMAGPLLAWIYPQRIADRDVAQAERAALRGTAGYKALVVVPDAEPAATAVLDLATAVVRSRRPATLALARLVPYPAAPLEIGNGLLEMNQAMAELKALAARAGGGPDVPMVARFTSNPAEDLAEIVRTGEPDLVVMTDGEPGGTPMVGTVITLAATPPAPTGVVIARLTGDTRAEAVLRTAAELAAAHQVTLIVDAEPPVTRRLAATVRELRRHGLTVREGSDDVEAAGALVVAADSTAGANVVVRASIGEAGKAPEPWASRLGTSDDKEATQVNSA